MVLQKNILKVNDSITLKMYGDKTYTFEIDGIYYYPASLSIFMDSKNLMKLLIKMKIILMDIFQMKKLLI